MDEEKTMDAWIAFGYTVARIGAFHHIRNDLGCSSSSFNTLILIYFTNLSLGAWSISDGTRSIVPDVIEYAQPTEYESTRCNSRIRASTSADGAEVRLTTDTKPG